MAGERIGKTYEAILKVALEQLDKQGAFSGRVFWNETPAGISTEPDFLIGQDKNHPDIVVMVTHSGSSKNSDMKCWRNIGELCEAKTALKPVPIAISLFFESMMKEQIKLLQGTAFDSQLIVDDRPYGQELKKWVHAHESELSSDQDSKAHEIDERYQHDSVLRSFVDQLAADVKHMLSGRNPELSELWDIESQRPKGIVPTTRKTFIRRGFTKRLLAGEAIKNPTAISENAAWLAPLGIVSPSIKGYQVADPELKWFLNLKFAKDYQRIGSICSSKGFQKQIVKVRSFALLTEYRKYVINNYSVLSSTDGMLKCMEALEANPSDAITIPAGIEAPQNIWIYDYIAALSNAATGKSQAFGYSAFANHPEGNKSNIGGMTIGQWCSHFAGEYFNRKGIQISQQAKIHIAKVLSEELQRFSPRQITAIQAKIEEQYIKKEYVKILLAHRGFEPLLALLISQRVVPSTKSKVNIRTCFAERAGLTGQAGETTVVVVRHTIINWQSAYEGHSADKRKELAGRAVGLRYKWDDNNRRFILRPGIKKLILLIDGSWPKQHLNTLINAGWDEIYYPDEIDKLKAAIV